MAERMITWTVAYLDVRGHTSAHCQILGATILSTAAFVVIPADKELFPTLQVCIKVFDYLLDFF